MAGPLIQPLTKRDALNQLLEDGITMVYLDARAPGVDVPRALRGNPNLRLNVSRRFPRPLEVEEDGMTAVLSFGGVPYRCIIPWRAVFGMLSQATHKELLWPEDIPPELLDGADELAEPAGPPRDKAPLHPVPDPAPLPAGEGEPAPSPPRRGHLRLVK
ncbi:MAG: stringent starvation protein B [Deltaproteobacteria bacterium]|nr:stringent starvation protein B [Deltaproteobacteria bacterium]